MRLFLMQHAHPKPKEEDPQQSLSFEGERDARAMGRCLASWGVVPSCIYHSPKQRAKETAYLVAEGLPGSPPLVEKAVLVPLADPGLIQKEIETAEGDLMIVGHMPHVARLATRLLTSGDREEPVLVAFRQGAVLCLKREAGAWKVAWMMTPDILTR